MTTASNTITFKTLVSGSGFFTADSVGDVLRINPQAAFLGLCEVHARQTEDERISGGTCHKNKFGFSKRHVTPGTALAVKFLAGEELTIDDMGLACKIAYAYRMQLWMICLGAVPQNTINLRPQLTQSAE